MRPPRNRTEHPQDLKSTIRLLPQPNLSLGVEALPIQSIADDLSQNNTSPLAVDSEIVVDDNTTILSVESGIAIEAINGRIAQGDSSILATNRKGKVEAIEVTHPLLENISPPGTGLIIALVDPACHSTFVHQALARLLTDGSSELGIPPSNVKAVCSLFSGNPRQIEHAKTIIDATPTLSGVPCDVEYVSAHDRLNWISAEGQLILFRYLKELQGGSLIADQLISGPAALDFAAVGLNRISTKAKEADVQVIMIISAPAALIPAFKQVCDEYLEVTPCEADLGVQMAFSIDYPCISDLGIGLGKVMCSIQYADGKFHYSYTPFISDSLDKRIVWTMRGQGQTLEEIGARLKINKSTVLRRLKDLPPRRRLKDAEEWLSPYFEETSHCAGASPDSSTLDADWDDGNPSGDADGA